MFDTNTRRFVKQWKMMFLVGIMCGLGAILVTLLFFPLEYRADAQVLVISKTRYGVDPYTVVKSAERVGENIAAVMRTNDFFEKVWEQTAYAPDKSYFENVPDRTKLKRWARSVQPSVVYGTGVLSVSGYGRTDTQAIALAGAAANAIVAHGWEYVGGDVTLKVVNNPVVTGWPVRPNVFMNGVMGFLIGLMLAGIIVTRK